MRKMIYHITSDEAWQRAQAQGSYMPVEFLSDGFILAAHHAQLKYVADFIFGHQDKVLVLEIDPGKLKCEIRMENSAGGDELFPHIYGALPLDAVRGTFHMRNSDKDGFQLPVQH